MGVRDLMRAKRGAIDLDGVLALTYGKFITEVNRRFGYELDPNYIFENYDLCFGTTISPKHMHEIFNSPGFYKDLPISEDGLQVLRALYADGFQLHIITARPNSTHVRNDTLSWLAEHSVPFDSVHILTSHNDYGNSGRAKAEVAEQLNLGWAVEDSPDNAIAYADVCDTVYLLNASYNKNVTMPDNVIRIDTLVDMAVDVWRREEELRLAYV